MLADVVWSAIRASPRSSCSEPGIPHSLEPPPECPQVWRPNGLNVLAKHRRPEPKAALCHKAGRGRLFGKLLMKPRLVMCSVRAAGYEGLCLRQS